MTLRSPKMPDPATLMFEEESSVPNLTENALVLES